MSHRHRLSLLTGAACALATLVPHSSVLADTLNWGTSGYVYNASQAGTNSTPGTVATVNGTTVSIQYSTASYFKTNYTNNNQTVPSPAVGTYNATTNVANQVASIYTDGGTGGSKALQILADFTDGTNILKGAGITVTVFFSKPVSNLLFSFYDADSNASGNAAYNDFVTQIYGTPSAGGANVVPTVTAGLDNTATKGSTFSSFTGTASSAQNVGDGNGTVSFDGTPITSFTFTYTDTAAAQGGAAHSPQQIIALSNLSYNVPEPSTWACVAAAAGLGVWALRRRARQTA